MAVILKYVLLILYQIMLIFASDSACKTDCLRKCCQDNESLGIVNNTTTCVKNSAAVPLSDVINVLPTNIIHGKSCPDDLYKVKLDRKILSFEVQNGKVFWDGEEYDGEKSCVDTFEKRLVAFICVAGEDESDIVKSVGMIISMPFLLLTFIAYALLPDRNLHMKALMIYVINLMLGYLLLVIIQLSTVKFSEISCSLLGYFCLFFFVVSFFWMNVICVDIWFTFSGLRGFSGSKKAAERKRFFIYCGYAFGVPLLQVLIVHLIDANATKGSNLKPDIGTGQCFLKRGYPELLYFYGPMAILITINIVLFAITAIKIRNIKKDTSMLKKEDSKRHSYENDKQTFNLYLKLLFAMGVNWSMEIISWLIIWQVTDAPEYIWYLTDFCNAIYGVFIFFIFVFKRSTWKLLKKRYYSFIGKPHLAHSMTMTNTTRVTSYSTTNSSIHEHPHGGANDTSTLTNEA